MKLTEIAKPSDAALLEAVSGHTEGFRAEDLVSVIRTQLDEDAEQDVLLTGDQLSSMVEGWARGAS